MRIFRHKINELDPERGYGERKLGVIYYVRRFWTIYKKPIPVVKRGQEAEYEKELFSGHLEIRIKPALDFAWKLRVGNSRSETPWDGQFTIFGAAFYWGCSRGRRFAQWLTHSRNPIVRNAGTPHEYTMGKYRNRSIGFYTFEGSLYTSFWVDEHGDSDNTRPARWRRKSIALDIRDHLFGPERYRYIPLSSVKTVLKIEESNSPNGIKTAYPVELELQRCEKYRTKRPNKVIEHDFSIAIDAPKGIPTHYDKSGGWKGDSTYGWSIKFPHGNQTHWINQAEQLVLADIFKKRGKSGFTVTQVD